MEASGEPWNLNSFAMVSRRILQTGSACGIWQNFPRKTELY